jgi:hypothetical protein
MSTAIATASPVISGDQVTSRGFFFTQNANVLPVVTVGPTSNTASIPCVPGDAITFYVIDTNVNGPSVASNVVSSTDPFPPPTGVPTTPTALTLTFTDP